jgi:Fe-S cluster biogenesis protein NfuA
MRKYQVLLLLDILFNIAFTYSFHLPTFVTVRRITTTIDGVPSVSRSSCSSNTNYRHNNILFSALSENENISDIEADTTSTSTSTTSSTTSTATIPQLDGKKVLPYKIIMNGLKGYQQQKIPAVYAIYNSNYQRNTDGWDTVTYVGATQDLVVTLQTLYENDSTQLKVTHVRALSFTYPQPNIMQEIASQWRQYAINANAPLDNGWANDVLNYLYDTEDNDDDDDDDDDDDILTDMEMIGSAMATAAATTGTSTATTSSSSTSQATTIISPFAETTSSNNKTNNKNTTEYDTTLPFTIENIDTILNDVRPYLIADGGNVSIINVDVQEQIIYLQLQGACGTCPSSTITMQMGIERILREKFPSLKEIIRVDENNSNSNGEVNEYERIVQDEINRIRPAIQAMGGTIQLISIDMNDNGQGIVQIQNTGRISKKVQNGIELALLDIDFIKEVQFV